MLTTRKQNWGEDRVTFFDEDEPDAFTRAAAGRAWLRADDLARLRALVDEVRGALQRRRV